MLKIKYLLKKKQLKTEVLPEKEKLPNYKENLINETRNYKNEVSTTV